MPKKVSIDSFVPVSETVDEYINTKKEIEETNNKVKYNNYVSGLTHEQVVQKVTDLVAENKIIQSKMSELRKEIEESEKILNIKCTPENIVLYKNNLDKAMRTALKTIKAVEDTLIEESKDVPDDVRRKWLEDVINENFTDTKTIGSEELK